ncbi:hypothetical protein ACHAQA_009721 [Verticillium albo-atrum]
MSDPQKYTVGWICAITTEFVAAQAFLDQEHDAPHHVAPHDNNSYVLGSVGRHNVVIAVLPDAEYGTTSAATVARDMLHSFPNVRIGLMVGIGGGAPRLPEHDVRLGDVVVSSAAGGNGGVLQYDFGKTIQNQSFQHTGFLNQSPPVLRTAISALKGKYELRGHQLHKDVDGALKRIKKQKRYTRPPAASDRLYKPGIAHRLDGFGCCSDVSSEDPSRLVIRTQRDEEDDDPKIHYGLIASANRLMKDATTRDKLAAEKDVLCFEMEAAGLVNHFPCLVVRGICDYADSHKNKDWQGFAAMMAAAYAKDLLRQIPPNKVEAERPVSEILGLVREDMQRLQQITAETKHAVTTIKSDDHLIKLERWLSPPDYSTNAKLARERRHTGTGAWLLESSVFQQWKAGTRRHLWLYGLAGCGKTVLSTTILDHLKTDAHITLVFFFDFNDTKKQTLDGLLRELLSWMRGIVSDSALDNTRFIATGRPEAEFQHEIPDFWGKENCVSLDKEAVDADIQSYVVGRLARSSDFVDKRLSRDLLDEIRDKVGNGANGIGLHQTAQGLLANGADVNAQGGHFGNALQAALLEGYTEIVRLLLAKGADVNAQGGDFGNALQAASLGGHTEIVALQAASLEGYTEIVRLLLAKGANVNAKGGYYGNALQDALLEGYTEIMQLLLAKGADVNAQGGDFGNAL